MRTSERGHHSEAAATRRPAVETNSNKATRQRSNFITPRSLASSHWKPDILRILPIGDKERDTGVVPRDLHLTVSPYVGLLSSAAFLQSSSNSFAFYSERAILSLSLSFFLVVIVVVWETGRQADAVFLPYSASLGEEFREIETREILRSLFQPPERERMFQRGDRMARDYRAVDPFFDTFALFLASDADWRKFEGFWKLYPNWRRWISNFGFYTLWVFHFIWLLLSCFRRASAFANRVNFLIVLFLKVIFHCIS